MFGYVKCIGDFCTWVFVFNKYRKVSKSLWRIDAVRRPPCRRHLRRSCDVVATVRDLRPTSRPQFTPMTRNLWHKNHRDACLYDTNSNIDILSLPTVPTRDLPIFCQVGSPPEPKYLKSEVFLCTHSSLDPCRGASHAPRGDSRRTCHRRRHRSHQPPVSSVSLKRTHLEAGLSKIAPGGDRQRALSKRTLPSDNVTSRWTNTGQFSEISKLAPVKVFVVVRGWRLCAICVPVYGSPESGHVQSGDGPATVIVMRQDPRRTNGRENLCK